MEDSELPSVASPTLSETTSTSQRRRRLDQHHQARDSSRRDSRRYGFPRPADVSNIGAESASPARSLSLLGRQGSTHASLSDARSNTIDATIWSQGGIGEDAWVLLAKFKSMEAFGTTDEMGWQFLDMYWTWLHPLHNCIYWPVFVMDMALNGTYYSDFLLMSIFALAARHLSRQEGDSVDSNMGERFFTRAKMLLMDELNNPKPRIPTIQGLLILGWRQCAFGKSSQGWLLTGMAIRMMVDIGMHLNANRIAELERLTPSEIETRKRLYNSAFIWDKTLSLALGRPPSLTGSPYGPDEIYHDRYDDAPL
ncbi:nitrogen assimilation transcription factor nit-4 [Fusarium mexicanum]|uniref:Nitrogen assimilation transcription factor nit-4 n=1 Tax=Fusarium mexicanum TaxID=751941 RepID=A0A8H5I4A5_9HYPO|nr:nitrogen assimilation transcription factor nit-4 [Fusarium mexicanum]